MRERIIYLLIAMCIAVGCYANEKQLLEYKYIPLVREGVEWVYQAGRYLEEGERQEWLVMNQFIGTKEINGKTYYKLYSYSCTVDTTVSTPPMYMREEDKKVYGIGRDWSGNYWSHEELIYDFSLGVGDTLRILYEGHARYGKPVIGMQKLYRLGDSFVKGFQTMCYYQDLVDKDGNPRMDDEYIEGVGSPNLGGYLYEFNQPSPDDGSFGPFFLYLRDIDTDEIIYPMNGREKVDCQLQSAPGIFADMMLIETGNDEIVLKHPGSFEVTIFDLEGRTCGSYKASDELHVSTIGMSRGVYIVNLADTDGNKSSAKFSVR